MTLHLQLNSNIFRPATCRMQPKAMQQAQRLFMTSLCLVTTKGPRGRNVMAAEWMLQVSYEPMLIAAFIHEGSSTLENIKKTKRFGINLASEAQATQISIAGGYSRREVDKLNLRGVFQTYQTSSGIPMIKGCLINAECELQSIRKTGDHKMVIGRVVSIKHDGSKRPLVYHQNRYFEIGPMVEPERTKLLVRKEVFDALVSHEQQRFIEKIACVTSTRGDKILVLGSERAGMAALVPFVRPAKHRDNKVELEHHLKKTGLRLKLGSEPRIKRLTIRNGDRVQRINFIIFNGLPKGKQDSLTWKPFKKDSLLAFLVR